MRVIHSGLRAEMARRKVSQQELAQRLDVHPNTVGNWVRGESDPTIEKLLSAMIALGVSKDDMLDMRLSQIITIENGNKKTPAE